MKQNSVIPSDIRTMNEITEWLQGFASRCHSLISLKFYDGVMCIHVEEKTMIDTFETATWEWRLCEQFPIRLVARVDGVAWFSLFTIERATQCGCTLMA